jgi:hypothetical protein
MIEGLREIDCLYVVGADQAPEQIKEAKTRRMMQKRRRDDVEEETQDDYGAGIF